MFLAGREKFPDCCSMLIAGKNMITGKFCSSASKHRTSLYIWRVPRLVRLPFGVLSFSSSLFYLVDPQGSHLPAEPPLHLDTHLLPPWALPKGFEGRKFPSEANPRIPAAVSGSESAPGTCWAGSTWGFGAWSLERGSPM